MDRDRIDFRIPPDLNEQLNRIAHREGRSRNAQMVFFLRREVAKYEGTIETMIHERELEVA